MALEITTHGGGEALFYILNAVAAITGGGAFMSLIKISLGFGTIWISFRTAFAFPFGDSLKWFMFYLVLYNAMLLPKETVLITDSFDPTFARTVDNVPIGVAMVGSYSSEIGTGIAELFDQAFALPDDMKYSTSGFLFGSKLVQNAAKLKINNTEFASNMEQFITQCVFFDIALGKYTADDLRQADDLWGFLNNQNTQSALRMFTYNTGGNREYVTCNEGSRLLASRWNGEINNQMHYLYRRNVGYNTPSQTAINYISSYIETADNYLMNSAKSATDIIRQNMMINAINDASYSYGSSSVAEYSNLITNQETKNSFEKLALQAEEWVPLLRTVFEAILYGIFPFIFLVFLLPSGHKALMGYLGAFVWIQSWPPLYAILHLLMTLRNKSQLAFADGSHTLDNFMSISDVNDNIAILSGAMIICIPYISLKLLPFAQSGLAGMGQMAGSILAPASSAATSGAHEASRGNFSMGNTSFDNHSFDNNSAHKFDTAFANQSFGGNLQNSDGSITKITGDRQEHIDTTQMQSNFSHDIKTSMSMSNALQQRAGISQSMGQNLEQESLKYQASSFDIAAKMAHSYSQGKDSGESWTQGLDSNVRKAFDNINSIVERGSGEGGVSIGAGGIKIGANYTVSKDDQEQLTNSVDLINKSSQSGHFNIHDSQGKSLNDELNSSYSQYQQLSNKASNYFNESKNLSTEASKSKSLDATVSTNEASGFYGWLTKDLGYNRQEAVGVIENPDRTETFQFLSNKYLQNKVDHLYSQNYGQNLMDNMQVNKNAYAKQSANFNGQHGNDIINRTNEVKSAYNNSNIDNLPSAGIDKSGLVEGMKVDINKHQQEINNAPKHEFVDNIENNIKEGLESAKEVIVDRFKKSQKGE